MHCECNNCYSFAEYRTLDIALKVKLGDGYEVGAVANLSRKFWCIYETTALPLQSKEKVQSSFIMKFCSYCCVYV